MHFFLPVIKAPLSGLFPFSPFIHMLYYVYHHQIYYLFSRRWRMIMVTTTAHAAIIKARRTLVATLSPSSKKNAKKHVEATIVPPSTSTLDIIRTSPALHGSQHSPLQLRQHIRQAHHQVDPQPQYPGRLQ